MPVIFSWCGHNDVIEEFVPLPRKTALFLWKQLPLVTPSVLQSVFVPRVPKCSFYVMFQQSFNVVDNDCYYQMRGIPSVGRCVFPALW